MKKDSILTLLGFILFVALLGIIGTIEFEPEKEEPERIPVAETVSRAIEDLPRVSGDDIYNGMYYKPIDEEEWISPLELHGGPLPQEVFETPQKESEPIIYEETYEEVYEETYEEMYEGPYGDCLTPYGGVYWFGDQKETYYNLDMSYVVYLARQNGLQGEYWVREDGCKMFGDYIILACNRDVHPYGSLVETSLGTGISLDTGGFAANNPYQVDVAVTW